MVEDERNYIFFIVRKGINNLYFLLSGNYLLLSLPYINYFQNYFRNWIE